MTTRAAEMFWEAYRAATFAVFLQAHHVETIDASPIADLARELWRQALAEQARAARS
jgi:hypothetical protein